MAAGDFANPVRSSTPAQAGFERAKEVHATPGAGGVTTTEVEMELGDAVTFFIKNTTDRAVDCVVQSCPETKEDDASFTEAFDLFTSSLAAGNVTAQRKVEALINEPHQRLRIKITPQGGAATTGAVTVWYKKRSQGDV